MVKTYSVELKDEVKKVLDLWDGKIRKEKPKRNIMTPGEAAAVKIHGDISFGKYERLQWILNKLAKEKGKPFNILPD